MAQPSSILLLHGLHGSGEGSVKLLEQALRQRGWDQGTYLRPTLNSVNHPEPGKPMDRVFVQAWDELNSLLGGRIPHLTVGFSFGGGLAPLTASPLRLSVCSPLARVPADIMTRISSRPGWRVLQGGRDEVVPAEENLAALPDRIPRTLDPEGTHEFDEWMDRIADWIIGCWQEHPLGPAGAQDAQ
ncbi:MAG: hypothetical protein H6Q00_2236 [Holophagaceae bacterium]|nr:hypothetical protein [Holophagaceae bacterium]